LGAERAASVTAAVESVATVINLPAGPACPGAFPNMPNEFPLVLDMRQQLRAHVEAVNAKGGAARKLVGRYSRYYKKRKIKAERMAQGVMIVLHNTAAGRSKARKVNGVRLGKKAGKYQTAPSKMLETHAGHVTPVHFFCDTYNSYWNWDFENASGAGDQDLNGTRARTPAIGIEIMHLASGVMGAPPRGSTHISSNSTYWTYPNQRGRKKWPKQLETQGDSLVDNAYSRTNSGGSILPPTQIAALRQTIQFIMSYLHKMYGTRIIYIATHRNGYSSKPSCPGQYAIRHGIAPVMKQLGLQPLHFATPNVIDFGTGPRKYTGPGRLFPELFFHDTIFETKWKGQPYLSKPFTRESGWNSMNRPLTIEEAVGHAGEYTNSSWYKGK
jgi:hypothetical protein